MNLAFQLRVAPVPEPATMLLLASRSVGLVGFRRFKKQSFIQFSKNMSGASAPLLSSGLKPIGAMTYRETQFNTHGQLVPTGIKYKDERRGESSLRLLVFDTS